MSKVMTKGFDRALYKCFKPFIKYRAKKGDKKAINEMLKMLPLSVCRVDLVWMALNIMKQNRKGGK